MQSPMVKIDAQASQPSDQQAVERVLGSTDLLENIFGRLGQRELLALGSVCGLWRQISTLERFWISLDLEGWSISPRQLEAILVKHPGVRSLNMVGIKMTDAASHSLFAHMLNLEILTMGKVAISSATLAAVAGSLPKLRRWTIVGAQLGNPDLGQTEVEVGHAGVKELEVAHIPVRPGAGICRLYHLVLRCPRLERLTLERGPMASLHSYCPSLTSIAMIGGFSLGDSGLRSTLMRLTALTRLDLSETSSFTDESLRELCHVQTRLVHLSLRRCSGITLKGVRGFPALRTLDLSSCNSLAASAMPALESWTTLEELRMDSCPLLASFTLTLPSLRCISLQDCDSLASVDLRCSRLEETHLGSRRATQGSPSGARSLRTVVLHSHAVRSLRLRGFRELRSVMLQCQTLASLDLSACEELNDSIFSELSSALPGTGCPNLRQAQCTDVRSLQLEGCMALRNGNLHNSSLTQLDLAGCSLLTRLRLDCSALAALHLDECGALEVADLQLASIPRLALGTCSSLSQLSLRAASLSILDLMGCGQLQSVQMRCPQLRGVDAAYCMGLGNDALAALLAGSPMLSALSLSVCSRLSDASLALLAIRPSPLAFLDLSYTDRLEAVFQACPRLHTLKLSSCRLLQPDTLHCLLPRPGAQVALPDLQSLDVSYCPLDTHTLTAMLSLGSRLQALEFNGCDGATDELWTGLSSVSSQHRLELLSAKGCKRLRSCWLGLAPAGQDDHEAQRPLLLGKSMASLPQDDGTAWEPVPSCFSGLRRLQLGLSGVRSLALALPHLVLLDLNACAELTSLRLHCPTLLTAFFQSCHLLPGRVLVSQLAASPLLERLDAQQSQVQDTDVEALKQHCPRVVLLQPHSAWPASMQNSQFPGL